MKNVNFPFIYSRLAQRCTTTNEWKLRRSVKFQLSHLKLMKLNDNRSIKNVTQRLGRQGLIRIFSSVHINLSSIFLQIPVKRCKFNRETVHVNMYID